MSDLPPDRARLLAIRTYLQLQLAAVDAALARTEQAEQQAPPPGDDVRWWRIERAPKPGEHHALLHRGDCPAGQRGVTVTRREAAIALQDIQADKMRTAAPCPKCRPDLDLDTSRTP